MPGTRRVTALLEDVLACDSAEVITVIGLAHLRALKLLMELEMRLVTREAAIVDV